LAQDTMLEIAASPTNPGEATIWLRDAGAPFRIYLLLGKNARHSSPPTATTTPQRVD
jgi:hypothetical protein